VAEQRLDARPLASHAGMPLGHVARLGGVEPEAEAIPHLAVLRHHSRDESFLAALQPHGVDVNKS